MNNYRTFIRSWWKSNPKWLNGLEPHMGRKKTIRSNLTREEAQRMCAEYNNTHNPGKLSRKMEFESY